MNANIRNNGSLASFKHNVFKSFLAEQKAAMFLRLYVIVYTFYDVFIYLSHNVFLELFIIFYPKLS